MRLTVYSHKQCWISHTSPTGVATNGGFPFQLRVLSELFDETTVLVPVSNGGSSLGSSPLTGNRLRIRALTVPRGHGLLRRLLLPFWMLRNGRALISEAVRASAVHAPIPGDVGTFGMLLAWLLRKRLLVRYCGDWSVQKTAAERFWRWFIERFAGVRTVMLVTGGSSQPPSFNPHVRWIFSSSLSAGQLEQLSTPRVRPSPSSPRLVIAARQDVEKGTGVVIESLPLLASTFPGIRLEVLGDGAGLSKFRALANQCGVASRVTFHGAVSHDAVLAEFRQADVMCFPTSASEGFPKAVLEALACGLPVVTSAVSVLPRLIGTRCGVTLQVVTPRALADAVRELLLDPVRYAELSREAVAVAREYSLERWRDTIGELLHRSWGPTCGRGNGIE